MNNIRRALFFTAIAICFSSTVLAQNTVNKLLSKHRMTKRRGVTGVVKTIIDNSSERV